MLPVIIQSDSIQKSVTDTLIERKRYYRVDLYFPGKRLAAFNGFTTISVDSIQWKYELIIDKKSMLPRQFNVRIYTPSNKTDYIRVTFHNIQLNGPVPGESSWYFSTYRDQYPNHTARRNEMVKAGTIMSEWKLPVYNSNNNADTLRSENLKGKVVVLEFWIRSCSYCMAALPNLNDIQAGFDKDSFRLITINCYDTKEHVGFFHQKYAPNYMMCYDGLRLAEKLGIYAYPMTLLIDREGNILDVSPFDKTSLIKKVAAALHGSVGMKQ